MGKPAGVANAAVLNRLHLIRHNDVARHEQRVKNIQLRHERLAAERADNVRAELNRLVQAYRSVNPNARIATTRKAVSKYYKQIHGFGPYDHR